MKPRVGYTFKIVREDDSVVLSYLPGTSYVLDDLLQHFKEFLRGAGYMIDVDSDIQIISENEDENEAK